MSLWKNILYVLLMSLLGANAHARFTCGQSGINRSVRPELARRAGVDSQHIVLLTNENVLNFLWTVSLGSQIQLGYAIMSSNSAECAIGGDRTGREMTLNATPEGPAEGIDVLKGGVQYRARFYSLRNSGNAYFYAVLTDAEGNFAQLGELVRSELPPANSDVTDLAKWNIAQILP